jgi:hypothetical protein
MGKKERRKPQDGKAAGRDENPGAHEDTFHSSRFTT